jgi:hypothetical protein
MNVHQGQPRTRAASIPARRSGPRSRSSLPEGAPSARLGNAGSGPLPQSLLRPDSTAISRSPAATVRADTTGSAKGPPRSIRKPSSSATQVRCCSTEQPQRVASCSPVTPLPQSRRSPIHSDPSCGVLPATALRNIRICASVEVADPCLLDNRRGTSIPTVRTQTDGGHESESESTLYRDERISVNNRNKGPVGMTRSERPVRANLTIPLRFAPTAGTDAMRRGCGCNPAANIHRPSEVACGQQTDLRMSQAPPDRRNCHRRPHLADMALPFLG